MCSVRIHDTSQISLSAAHPAFKCLCRPDPSRAVNDNRVGPAIPAVISGMVVLRAVWRLVLVGSSAGSIAAVASLLAVE